MLLPRAHGTIAEADLLDILMAPDRAVRGLAQDKTIVTQLRVLLTEPTRLPATDALLEQLRSIAGELRSSLATPVRVAALKLPARPSATLLQACALKADSPDADWQAVGQAAMAAVRNQSA